MVLTHESIEMHCATVPGEDSRSDGIFKYDSCGRLVHPLGRQEGQRDRQVGFPNPTLSAARGRPDVAGGCQTDATLSIGTLTATNCNALEAGFSYQLACFSR